MCQASGSTSHSARAKRRCIVSIGAVVREVTSPVSAEECRATAARARADPYPAGTPGTLAAVATKRALVLAGGGLAGIAWETGILLGIGDEEPMAAKALLDVDVMVGTSAGSTVAAQLGSGLGLDALFDRQITASSAELNPSVEIDEITDLFLAAMSRPNTTKAETLQKIGAVALSTATVTEGARRDVIA